MTIYKFANSPLQMFYKQLMFSCLLTYENPAFDRFSAAGNPKFSEVQPLAKRLQGLWAGIDHQTRHQILQAYSFLAVACCCRMTMSLRMLTDSISWRSSMPQLSLGDRVKDAPDLSSSRAWRKRV